MQSTRRDAARRDATQLTMRYSNHVGPGLCMEGVNEMCVKKHWNYISDNVIL